MTLEILFLLLLIAAAMFVFALEWLPVDLVTIILISALVLLGLLTPEEAFSGFANEVIIILCCVFALSGALVRTGVMGWLGDLIYRIGGGSERRILRVLMPLSAGLSAFINNTNATAILMPAAAEVAKKSRVSPSRVLMPLAFASILGGTCTLIGTSTNVAASGMLAKLGYEPFSLFEFAPVGLVAVVIGILYMSVIGYRLLPEHPVASLSEQFEIQEYLSQIVVEEGSTLVGETLRSAKLRARGLIVMSILREGVRIIPTASTVLLAGDLLNVMASREALLQTKDDPGLRIEADVELGDKDLAEGDVRLVEAVILPSSRFAEKTMKELRLRQRYGVSVLAIYRTGHYLALDVRALPIHIGDVVLLQGKEEHIRALQDSRDLWLVGEIEHLPRKKRKGLIAIASLLGGIVLGGLGIIPLSVALLLSTVVLVLTHCITPQEIYEMVEWRLIVLIGGMTSVGLAMQKTEAAEYLAGILVAWVLPFGIYALLGALALCTMIFTQPLSNAAAALVMLPIAISTADQLGVNPRTFAVMVTLAASLSFITPLEPACLLVYGPGRYRFRDFVISGSVLTLLSLLVLMVLVPLVWPLGT